MIWRKAAFLVSVSALAACANNGAAPVVYGSQPQWQGRIYNSADEIADERARADARRVARNAQRPGHLADPRLANRYALDERERATPAPVPVVEVSEPSPLERASASRPQRFDYDARPVYLNADERAAVLSAPRAQASTISSVQTVDVRAGDTVYAISRRTGANPQAIIRANGLKQPYHLDVGQKLIVPGAGPDSGQSAAENAPATISLASSASARRSDRTHMVRAGDTLFSISRSTGVAVEAIARANGLTAPYTLSVGDRLRVPGSSGAAQSRQAKAAASAEREDRNVRPDAISLSAPAKTPDELFNWPVKGAIIGKYSKGGGAKRNDGINIAAPVGTPVRAAADGEVVYRGAELDGYGNLLLVKHDDGYVTAYAHNEAMLVRKGDRVRQGQVIAKVGQTGSATQPQLHFEIRQNLKAVDPMAFLGG